MDEHGWLIERASPPRWWDGAYSNTWTTDSTIAVRFARKRDAEAVLELLRRFATQMDDATTTEHLWNAA